MASLLPGPFASWESLFGDRFWKLGGMYLKSYEFVPVIYGVVILLLCVFAYRGFVRGKKQVEKRKLKVSNMCCQ